MIALPEIKFKESKLSHKNSFNELEKESSLDMLQYIKKQPLNRLRSIQKKINFALKEQGITFGQRFDNSGKERFWNLDFVPHVISGDEFDFIYRGCKQRITALNMLLNDIYSENRILQEKVIPKEVILGDDNYLRSCVNVKIPNDVYIHLSATDISRDCKGEYHVVDDNVAIPSGIGYAILNRQILRQQFPGIFDNRKIRSAWNTTSLMLSSFKDCAPRNVTNPSIVLLSPGIYNDAYSEHEYLANQMGIPLVHPKDLLVKENHVFMKTVDGHSRVDIIYRRIQDYYIDPVSFYHDSILGVPGLFSCVYHGNVTVVNSIGSGVASSKALLPYIDDIIRFYLSEEPILKTVDTMLLHKDKIVEHVFQNIKSYVIKSSQGTGGRGVLIGEEATKAEVAEWKNKVLGNPFGYVAQKLSPLSCSRIFSEDALESRYVETRFYSFLGKNFHLSNAALTRVAYQENSLMVCNSMGGGSKDTWIMGDSMPSLHSPISIFSDPSKQASILSRVAENLFWLGRYMNRVLTTANVLQVTYSSELDQLIGSYDPSYKRIMISMSRLTGTPTSAFANTDTPWFVAFFRQAVADLKNPYSMVSNINFSMNNAREIQNYLPDEMWTSLRKLSSMMENIPDMEKNDPDINQILDWLGKVFHYCLAFFGLSLDTFSRQEILQYVQLGRYIEHCSSISMVLKATLKFTMDAYRKSDRLTNMHPFIIIMLKILNSYEAYQWTYQANYEPYLAYRMLLIDKNYSNSFVNCLIKIKQILFSTSQLDIRYMDESPEYLCDLLVSRAFSFDLKKHLSKSIDSIQIYQQRPYEIIFSKNSLATGAWTLSLIRGIRQLANKIIDRYTNIAYPTPFTRE